MPRPRLLTNYDSQNKILITIGLLEKKLNEIKINNIQKNNININS